MTRQLVTTTEAANDLVEIWVYSYEQWGRAQADSYLSQLEQTIKRLVDDPLLGTSRDQIRRGYRSIRIGRHVVFYTVSDTELRIQRVLHARMDVDRHL